MQATNDAYVEADFTLVAPRVAGQIARVFVDDNQHVEAGQLLARIDDRDFRAALMSAAADVDAAKASVADYDAQIARHPAQVARDRATVRVDAAAIAYAQTNAIRYSKLSAGGAGTLQEQQRSASELQERQAQQDRDLAQLDATLREIDLLRAGRDKALGVYAHAQAAFDQAKLNVSYTDIRAPIAGEVGRRTLREGEFVNVGEPLLALVPISQAYIIANYQENQLARMRPGQSARITVDSFPDLLIHGHVDSLAPATGVSFTPIAPDDATGNFTKIVQRVPVKIVIDAGQPGVRRLRVGLSVESTVNVGADAHHGVPQP